MVNNGPPVGKPLYEGHRAIWMQEYDVKAQKLVGPRAVIVNGGVDLSKKPIWIEAPHIFKVKGSVLSDRGGRRHGGGSFRSRVPQRVGARTVRSVQRATRSSRSGISIPSRPAPITSTGHADFVQTPRGDWWAVFLGTRPYRDNLYNTGRETFLMPVRWENGWPIILTGNGDRAVRRRRLPISRCSRRRAIPTSGNFTYRDEFNGTTLAPNWMFIRTPRETLVRPHEPSRLADDASPGRGHRPPSAAVVRRTPAAASRGVGVDGDAVHASEAGRQSRVGRVSERRLLLLSGRRAKRRGDGGPGGDARGPRNRARPRRDCVVADRRFVGNDCLSQDPGARRQIRFLIIA